MIYNITQLDNFLSLFDNIEIVHKTGTKKYYYNVACSFDIETSSIYIDDNNNSIEVKNMNKKDVEKLQKISNMYIWQFAINDDVIYGRYWIQFIELINKLVKKLELFELRILPIYVHNLSYEFQYIFKMFNWLTVFAVSERKPIYAITNNGVEFRCSYILSGYNLDTVAKNLRNKTVKKLVGDLDYTLTRHNETILSDKELEYCFNDVLIVTQYINECIEDYKNITKIPYTQTGKARNLTRSNCFNNKEYKYFIKELKLSLLEYNALQISYSGGFTHSNAINTNMKIDNVASYDFTSSYPYVMLSEKYPMSTGRKIQVNDMETFNNLLNNYCCLFNIHIENVKPLTYNENILQYSKCYNVKKPLLNNGRIVKCDSLDTTVNEIDYKNIEMFYTFDSLTISNFYIYEKDYLPKEIIQTILKLYNDKTQLKGVKGKETEYLHGKELLNSLYGMCVTNTMKQNVIFNGTEWVKDSNFNINNSIDKYNKDRNRFLFYPWGVWVTSYARRNLFSGILECKNDYIYADTDSIKITNKDNHKEYFNNYNMNVETKLQTMCKHYNIDFNLCKPKTIKGVEKLIGVWDYEGTYKHFKTLGAKRYIVENDTGIEITVAGLSKKAIEYIKEQSKKENKDVFDFFNNYMYIPIEYTYKKTHTYIDKECICKVLDYMGKDKKVKCLSGVHLSPTDFTMSLGESYLDYLIKAKNIIEVRG